MSCIWSQVPHMISHSHVHGRTCEFEHVSTYTCAMLNFCRPPVRSGAPGPPTVLLPYGIMLGRYFCLLRWLLDMVFIWIGNLFSFESICSVEKRRGTSKETSSDLPRREGFGLLKLFLLQWMRKILACKLSLHVLNKVMVILISVKLDNWLFSVHARHEMETKQTQTVKFESAAQRCCFPQRARARQHR